MRGLCLTKLRAILCVCLLVKPSSESKTVVTTNSGILEGKPFVTSANRTVHSFLGVPFAKPPVGRLRFEEPEPFGVWEGTWIATKPGSHCLQIGPGGSPIGTEDCLYMNIYTPDVTANSFLPVLVEFHGGAFRVGGSSRITPYFLMDAYDLVLVTVNYRLGSLGFLSTGDDVVSGNNGLKDQVLALKWLQENIVFFGGNKNKVTIAGLSAGGVSVHFHFVSPLSRGLFNRGISSSGSALNHWALSKRPLQKAKGLAAALGCPTEVTAWMIRCLKQRPGARLISFDHLFKPWRASPFTIFGPVIENSKKNKPFLGEHPYRVMAEGRSFGGQWLAGVAAEDGLYPAAWFIDRPEKMVELEHDWLRIAPHLMDYNFTATSELDNVSSQIRNAYLGDERLSEVNTPRLVKMLTDRIYKVDMSKAVKMQATTSDVFFYLFNYRGSKSESDDISVSKADFGVCHGDDVAYIFGFSWLKPTPFESDGDRAMAKLMQRFWINFLNTGNPTGTSEKEAIGREKGLTWTPQPKNSTSSLLYYLLIDNASSFTMTSDANFGNTEFWSSLGFAENEHFIDLDDHRNVADSCSSKMNMALIIICIITSGNRQ